MDWTYIKEIRLNLYTLMLPKKTRYKILTIDAVEEMLMFVKVVIVKMAS